MTTITPTPTATIDILATLTSPFHHGAGSSGNTSILRTQDVIQPDGTVARAPFLSAASVRHALRDALAWHLVEHAGIEPGSLSKTAVDLIWSGGAVTSTGSRTDLEMLRRVEATLPSLAMLGYAACSDIITGTLRASDLILVCSENDWRLPERLRGRRRAAAYRGEEFGTRHDQAASPAGRYVHLATGVEVETTQMIWDTQVLTAGAALYGQISLAPPATPAHTTVLGAALALWAPGGETVLGAKSAQGYGRAQISGIGQEACQTALEDWTRHVTTHAADIRALIADMGA